MEKISLKTPDPFEKNEKLLDFIEELIKKTKDLEKLEGIKKYLKSLKSYLEKSSSLHIGWPSTKISEKRMLFANFERGKELVKIKCLLELLSERKRKLKRKERRKNGKRRTC